MRKHVPDWNVLRTIEKYRFKVKMFKEINK